MSQRRSSQLHQPQDNNETREKTNYVQMYFSQINFHHLNYHIPLWRRRRETPSVFISASYISVSLIQTHVFPERTRFSHKLMNTSMNR
jgi:hypothetical protein